MEHVLVDVYACYYTSIWCMGMYLLLAYKGIILFWLISELKFFNLDQINGTSTNNNNEKKLNGQNHID